MTILLLNWRDPKNPKSGGAEKLNLQILKPLIKKKHTIIWYALSYPGLPKKETFEGITIIRNGNILTHFLTWPILLLSGSFGKVGFIIDSIHGIGYGSTIFAPKTKKIILICEVAQNIWDEMWSFPLNKIGKILEKIQFYFYKREHFWTISESTKNDLILFGINAKNIEVVPMGFDGVTLPKLPEKAKEPTALFVGRLAEVKGIKDAIKAIAEVNKIEKRTWNLKIIGRGAKEYENELKLLVKELKVQREIRFLGFVNEQEKFNEMAKAWVLLVPSSREGWGMIVPEANSVGTPVIGYDVPGLSEVLRKYSRSNMPVKPSVYSLKTQILQLSTKLRVKEMIHPGWNQLHAFILKYFSS